METEELTEEPIEDPVDPVEDPVDPVEDPVDPPEDPVDPPEDPVDPPEEIIDSVVPSEDPADPPAWTKEDVSKIFELPLHEQVQKTEKSAADLLVEFKKLNEFLIPTPEELEEMEQKELEEQELYDSQTDYDPLILEQLEILNAHMEESVQVQTDTKLISAESSLMLAGTIIVAIAIKVLVDQITKW